jgi:hypothetical protein
MYDLIAIILCGYLLYRCQKILANTVCQNIMGVIGFLIAAMGSSLVFFISKKLAPYIFDNVLLQIAIVVAIAMLVFFLITHTVARTCTPFLERKLGTMPCLAQSSKLMKRGVNMLFLFCFLFCIFVFFDVLTQMISLLPQRAQIIRNSFLNGDKNRSLENFQQNLRQAIFRKLQHGFQHTRDFIAAKTGIKTILEYLNIVKKLFQLSDEEKIWLMQTTPALQKLANNPSLLAVMNDERLLTLIAEASEGSLATLYQLGEEPLIKNLFADKELVATMKHIQLKELLWKVKHRLLLPSKSTNYVQLHGTDPGAN